MAKVIWQVMTSLDGFIAGPDDDIGWHFEYPEPNPELDEVIASTGAMLAGRRSYEVGLREDLEAYEGSGWSGAEFVLTHEPPNTPKNPAPIFLTCGVREAVARALEAAEGKNVVVTGADVAGQCLDAGLVDEIHVHVAPLLLGGGIPLFGGRRARGRLDLEPVHVSTAGRVTNLRFRVRKGE